MFVVVVFVVAVGAVVASCKESKDTFGFVYNKWIFLVSFLGLGHFNYLFLVPRTCSNSDSLDA